MLTRLLRERLRPYAAQVAVVVTLLAIQSIGNLYLPNLNADIINNGVITGNVRYIFRTGVLMLGITLVLAAVAIVAVYWASRVSMGVGADVRAAVYGRVQGFSAREMNHFGTPSLITRNTNDVQQIQLFLQMALTLMVIAPIMCVGGVIMAVKEGAALSLLLAVAVPVMAANVSGGQRQRLSIARALVKRPPLYLFDDCFSALDAATDARLRAALRADTRDATVVIVSQRVSTIMQADQIIMLDEGRIAGIGAHQQLLATCAPYREIVTSQLGEGVAA
jgi:ABC-type multidrug transport system fused ATPase/permease subunit